MMRRKKYTHLVCIYSFLCIACIMGGNYYFNYLHDNAEKIYFQDMKIYIYTVKIHCNGIDCQTDGLLVHNLI